MYDKVIEIIVGALDLEIEDARQVLRNKRAELHQLREESASDDPGVTEDLTRLTNELDAMEQTVIKLETTQQTLTTKLAAKNPDEEIGIGSIVGYKHPDDKKPRHILIVPNLIDKTFQTPLGDVMLVSVESPLAMTFLGRKKEECHGHKFPITDTLEITVEKILLAKPQKPAAVSA